MSDYTASSQGMFFVIHLIDLVRSELVNIRLPGS